MRLSSDAPRSDVVTVLVVGDNPDICADFRNRVVRRYNVMESPTAEDGLIAARACIPDVVISDVITSGANGCDLCGALHASSETEFIPVILLTGQARPEQRIAGLRSGADDCVIRPFDISEVEARVDNLIASRRRLRARFATDKIPARVHYPQTCSAADCDFVDRLSSAMELGFKDPAFGVAELAAAVFQDRTNLFRRTRLLLNEAPSDLLRRVRLEHASKMLIETANPVAEIAYSAGFNSVSVFCRTFREVYGRTPSVFRDSVSFSQRKVNEFATS